MMEYIKKRIKSGEVPRLLCFYSYHLCPITAHQGFFLPAAHQLTGGCHKRPPAIRSSHSVKKCKFIKRPIALLFIFMNVSVLQAQLSISKQMLEHLNEIEQCIPHRDSLKPTVSKVDVAWHLDHSLKVINKIYEALESSQPSTYKYQFSWVRVVAFTMGDFPRGIAQSPQAVRPPEVIETEDLYAQLEEARNTLEKFMH